MYSAHLHDAEFIGMNLNLSCKHLLPLVRIGWKVRSRVQGSLVHV